MVARVYGLVKVRVGTVQVIGVQVAEGQCGCRASSEVGQQVDPDVRPGKQAHDRSAERDSGIEGAAADAPDRRGASENREADRQAVEGVPRVILAGCDVQYHGGEREGENELSD